MAVLRACEQGIRVAIFSLLLLLLAASPSFALDTTEPYELGASDFEFYLGAEGLGLRKYETALHADFFAAYGLTKRLSGYFGVDIQANEHLGAGEAALGFGIFGTPLDTEHVDLDLLLDASIAGAGLTSFALTPGFELNFDLQPDLALWGVYLRSGFALSARDESVSDDAATPTVNEEKRKYTPTLDIRTALGTYWTVKAGHQLFLQTDATVHLNKDRALRRFELGNLALGYNVEIHEAIELINQISLDIPQGKERASAGFMSGIIVTMP